MAQANILDFLRSNNPLPPIVQQQGSEAETQTMDDAGLNKLIEEMGGPQAVFQKYFGENEKGISLSPDGQTVNYRSDKENASGGLSGFMESEMAPIVMFALGAAAVGPGLAAGTGGGMTASELASADIALGGAGGSAGAASLGGTATSGSFIGDMIQKGVDWLGGGSEGGFDLGKMFDSFTEGVKSIFSPSESPWGVNKRLGEGASAALDFGSEAAADTVATQAADAAGIATSPADLAFTPAQAGVASPEVTNLVPQTGLSAAPKKGLIDSVIEWGKANPSIASGALQLGGGLLKGVGENAAMDKKIQAEKEIAAGRSPEAVLAAQRAQAASSGAYGQKVGFQAPTTPRTLRRPDGSIVYAQPGLIAGQMKG